MAPRRPAVELQQVFSDKAEARSAVWKALVAHQAARFPFPLKGRIPNFDGADRAAALLLAHPVFASAKCVKVNPDSPQRYVVMGSVAVTRKGERLGKGHGYADLEYGMLRALGNPAVPVATTVHPLQVLGGFPTESHDLPVSLIATPDELIEIQKPDKPPSGIDWALLPAQALEEMPVLAELKRLLASRSKARPRRKGKP